MIWIQDSGKTLSVRRAAADLVIAVLAWGASSVQYERGRRMMGDTEVIDMDIVPVVGPAVLVLYSAAVRWLA